MDRYYSNHYSNAEDFRLPLCLQPRWWKLFPARVGPFARDSERFVIRLLIGGTKKPR